MPNPGSPELFFHISNIGNTTPELFCHIDESGNRDKEQGIRGVWGKRLEIRRLRLDVRN
jgi:hypothetical protein